MSMNARCRNVCIAIALAALSGLVSAAGAFNTDAATSSAALDFRVVIPQIFRILENSHPSALPPLDLQTARISAIQRLVLVSTLPRGFCMDLQIKDPSLNDWHLQINTGAGTWLQATTGGYRLCTARAGRYDVALQHDFNGTGTADGARDWPVLVSLTTP
jgi:hypothetical protein